MASACFCLQPNSDGRNLIGMASTLRLVLALCLARHLVAVVAAAVAMVKVTSWQHVATLGTIGLECHGLEGNTVGCDGTVATQ